MQPTGATRPPMSAGPWRRARCTASVLRVAHHPPLFIRGESAPSFPHSKVLFPPLPPVPPPSAPLAPDTPPPTAAAGVSFGSRRDSFGRARRESDLEVDDEPHPAR